MPIRPEMKHLYPKNWDELAARAKARAGNKCERCGVRHGDWRERADQTGPAKPGQATDDHGVVFYRIILTVAHLNHNPRDCRPENLQALCQRCHLAHDAPHHARVRAANQAAQAEKAHAQAGQLNLI